MAKSKRNRAFKVRRFANGQYTRKNSPFGFGGILKVKRKSNGRFAAK